jgi:hypothetical protein
MKVTTWFALLLTAASLVGCVVDPAALKSESSSGCGCPPEPQMGSAAFAVGVPQFTSVDTFEVGLLVNAGNTITFSQFTVDFSSTCLEFLGAVRGSALIAGAAPFTNAGPGTASFPVANAPDFDRHVLTNVSGTYGPGCQFEVVRLRFHALGGCSTDCALRWDTSTPAANPPNHLVTDVPSQIAPSTITFCDCVQSRDDDDDDDHDHDNDHDHDHDGHDHDHHDHDHDHDDDHHDCD